MLSAVSYQPREMKRVAEDMTRSLGFALLFKRVAHIVIADYGHVGATVDFIEKWLVPRPALRNAKLRPGLKYCRPFGAVIGKLLVIDFA